MIDIVNINNIQDSIRSTLSTQSITYWKLHSLKYFLVISGCIFVCFWLKFTHLLVNIFSVFGE